MLVEPFSQDEHLAASAVASLAAGAGKRECEKDAEMRDCKRARTEALPTQPSRPTQKKAAPVLQLAPFFYYKNCSEEPDPDPLTPLTAPGRVPNFPAKMHAILSRAELREIVAWLPHGRSWRVLKPREFEIKVLPKYFEHAKFSSFVRQANGWGFRRITQGPDRNSYYHERFLRGLPHLSKTMKRPGVAEKKTADPEHEPDFYAISKIHPLPDRVDEDESILLQCTLQGGPKARVPIYTGAWVGGTAAAWPKVAESALLAPRDQFVLDSFHQSISASEGLFRGMNAHPPPAPVPAPLPSFLSTPSASSPRSMFGLGATATHQHSTLSALAAANQLALHMPVPTRPAAAARSSMAAALGASPVGSDFAAGFAAATAFSQHQFRNILDNLAHQHKNGSSHHGFPPSRGYP